MFHSKFVLRAACALTPLALAACALPVADMVPVSNPNLSPPAGFCNIAKDGPDAGKLIVTVRNDGVRAAPATTTVVEFRGVTTPVAVKLPTPPIAGSPGSARLSVAIPAACYEYTTKNCYFTVTVDAENAVTEISETNNTSWGVCGS
jgi:hypothetical protein